jgi:hypothetical protein
MNWKKMLKNKISLDYLIFQILWDKIVTDKLNKIYLIIIFDEINFVPIVKGLKRII